MRLADPGTAAARRCELCCRRTRGSDTNKLDVPAGGAGEWFDIVEIRGGDEVAIVGQQYQRGVDDVAAFRHGKQRTRRSPKLVIQGVNVDSGKHAGQLCLASAIAPCLTDHATMRDRNFPRLLGGFQAPPHGPVVPVERNQRPRIQDERHARRRVVARDPARMTRAAVRSRRFWASSSSAPMTPNSAS